MTAPASRQRDYRDLTIEDFAALLVRTERERDAYRELLSVSMTRLHDAEQRIRRQEQRIRGFFGLDDEQWRYVQRAA